MKKIVGVFECFYLFIYHLILCEDGEMVDVGVVEGRQRWGKGSDVKEYIFLYFSKKVILGILPQQQCHISNYYQLTEDCHRYIIHKSSIQ